MRIQQKRFMPSLPVGTILYSSAPSLFFYNTHTGIYNTNPKPVSVITGAPGSGKTFLAMSVAANAALLGTTVVLLDPKGDFKQLAKLSPWIGQVNVLSLAKGRPGLIDPFYLANTPEMQLSLAKDFLTIINKGKLSQEEENALTPILTDAVRGKNPSMSKLTTDLYMSSNQAARSLGMKLRVMSNMEFGMLCFAPEDSTRQPMEISSGTWVFDLTGLNLPEGGAAPEGDGQHLASGIMYLLANMLRRVMESSTSASKLIMIDEAHNLTGNPQGTKIIEAIALMGRSKDTAMCLITQMNSHLENLRISNTVSTRFAFASSEDDARATISNMNLPKNEGLEEVITTQLEQGTCFVSDWRGSHAVIQVNAWNAEWNRIFETNPDKKRKNAREDSAAAA